MAKERNPNQDPVKDLPQTPHPDRERPVGGPESDRPEIEGGGTQSGGPGIDDEDEEMETGPGPRTGGKGTERPNEQRTEQGGEGRSNPQNPAQDPERRTSTDRTGNR